LSLLLACEELHIIEYEDIDLTVSLTELVDRAPLDRCNIVSEELVCSCIDNAEVFVFTTDGIGSTLEEVRLAEPNITIEVERIV